MINSNSIKLAFDKALRTATINKFESNSLKSALFVQKVGEQIMENYDEADYRFHCQKVDTKNQEKVTGEWLLDGIIAKTVKVEEKAVNNLFISKEMIVDIEWAIESEYATSLQAFTDDFSKLLSINAKNKMYLNGYSSSNADSFKRYKNERLETVKDLVKRFDTIGNYYYCFWPSPEKKGGESFWEKIKSDSEMKNEILTLHEWNSEKLIFQPVENGT